MKYQEFHVAGTINETESDDGLISQVDAPVHLRAIIIIQMQRREITSRVGLGRI